MAVIKLVLLTCALVSPALSRPAVGGFNYNNPGAYNNYNNPGAYNYNNAGAYNYNGGYAGGDSFDPHPRYNYEYRVNEPRTGDYKSAQESRDGDAVRGSYSVAEPDGSLLTVRYAADDANGYTAVVERSGHGGTVVNTFPGPAPSAVAPVYNNAFNGGYSGAFPGAYQGGYRGAYGGAYGGAYAGPAVAPAVIAPAAKAYVAPAVRPAGAPFVNYQGYNGGYAGHGTTSTSFSGTHAAYHY